MPAPTVTSTSPIDGESNVFINKRLTVVFSVAVDTATITANTIRLTQASTGARYGADLLLSDDGLTVTITPHQTLLKNSSYRLTLLGASSGFSFKIQSTTADDLVTTLTADFTTGDDVEAYSAEKTDTISEREGDLKLPTDVQMVPGERIVVTATSPENGSFGQSLSLPSITVTTNAPISIAKYDASWVTINMYPLMGMTEYLAKDRGDGTIVFSIDDPEYLGSPVTFDQPTGVISVTGETITWTRATGEVFPYNTEIEVVLSEKIESTYGDTLLDRKRFTFTSEAYPMYSSVYAVEKTLPLMPQTLNRDYLYALIWRNSIIAWELSGKPIAPTKAQSVLREYTLYSTICEIIEAAEQQKAFLAGQTKRLGDFSVEWDPDAIGKESILYRKCKARVASAELSLVGRRIHMPRSVIKGQWYDRPTHKTRMWTSQSSFNRGPARPITEAIPAANTAASRSQTLPGAYNVWD